MECSPVGFHVYAQGVCVCVCVSEWCFFSSYSNSSISFPPLCQSLVFPCCFSRLCVLGRHGLLIVLAHARELGSMFMQLVFVCVCVMLLCEFFFDRVKTNLRFLCCFSRLHHLGHLGRLIVLAHARELGSTLMHLVFVCVSESCLFSFFELQ